MRKALSLVMFALSSLAFADGPIVPRFPAGHITTEELQRFKAEVQAVPDVQCASDAYKQLKCDSASQRTIWVFTQQGHAAHPAVSRGVMVVKNSPSGTSIGIDRSGHYTGNEQAFKQWMAEFRELDKKQVAEWSTMLRK